VQDIAKAIVEDPMRQAQRLRNLKSRICAVKNEITQIARNISPEAVATLDRQICAVKDAERAFAIASQDTGLLGQEPLPGVGGNEWRLLYEAAQKYSTEVAYREKEFPHTGDDSLCVLCMQHLSQEAKTRFRRFKSFMEQAVRRRRDETTAELIAALKRLCELDLEASDTYKDAFDEIYLRDKACADAVKEFLTKALVAKMAMESAAQCRTAVSLAETPACPSSGVQGVIDSMEDEAQRLEKSADPAKAASLKAEKEELVARKRLHEMTPQLTLRLQQLKISAKYNQCVRETDTTSITKKSRQIISAALTQEFEALLNRELSGFGSHIRLRLEMKGVAGETIHKLALRDCQLPPRARITDILCEGEQRIVSIASFLAELKACGRNNPVVFDDPVSSLDHDWREKVARRLTMESPHRQVIVFTHDIVFTTSMMYAAQSTQIPVALRCVQRIGDVPGATSDSIPWKAANVRQRIDALEKEVANLPAIWKTHAREQYEQDVCSLYSRIRATWEKTVEEVAFAGSVQRFEAHVRVSKGILKATVVDVNDWHALLSAHKKCCDITDAHDNIGPRNASVPDPAEVAQDLLILKNWVEGIIAKQRAFN
jgi:energy-coupling factor transporter ATP-binding protein EcfA2